MAKAKEQRAAEEVTPVEATSVADTPVENSSRSAVKDAASFNETVADIKAILDAQPKVRILVPSEPGEPKGTQLPVSINGYRMNVPKGAYVEVPQTVAEIIQESLEIYENNSATNMRLDQANSSKKDALDA